MTEPASRRAALLPDNGYDAARCIRCGGKGRVENYSTGNKRGYLFRTRYCEHCMVRWRTAELITKWYDPGKHQRRRLAVLLGLRKETDNEQAIPDRQPDP